MGEWRLSFFQRWGGHWLSNITLQRVEWCDNGLISLIFFIGPVLRWDHEQLLVPALLKNVPSSIIAWVRSDICSLLNRQVQEGRKRFEIRRGISEWIGRIIEVRYLSPWPATRRKPSYCNRG